MPRFAANLSMLFTELPFPERFAAAADAGFKGVEYLFPYDWPAQQLAQWLADNGLTQVLFNREGVFTAMDYAQALGCQQVNCLAGVKPDGLPSQVAFETLVENLRFAADLFDAKGLTLMLEAINSRVDMPSFLVDTSAMAMAVIEAVGRDNIRLQYDLYHMQIMEGDLCRSLSQLCPHIGHIQFADNPGRNEPGSGEIQFDTVFAHIDSLEYVGWVSAEYWPQKDTATSLGWFNATKQEQ